MAQPIFDEHPLQDYLRRVFLSYQAHPLSRHIIYSFTESGDVFEPIPGAISGLSCPFSDDACPDGPDHDLNSWSFLTTPTLRLAQVSLPRFTIRIERVPLVDPTAVSISAAPCHAVQCQRLSDLH